MGCLLESIYLIHDVFVSIVYDAVAAGLFQQLSYAFYWGQGLVILCRDTIEIPFPWLLPGESDLYRLRVNVVFLLF